MNLARYFGLDMQEKFPVITMILTMMCVVIFLFTMNIPIDPVAKNVIDGRCEITCPKICRNYIGYEVCTTKDQINCVCYIPRLTLFESLLGFIPSSPRIYSLITYIFIHGDISHILSNVLMLILVGIILENSLDKLSYVLIYMTSGVVSAVFDTLSRGVLGISSSLPFIGASGAIFGLAGVAMLLKPYEKLPSFTVVLFAAPLIMLMKDYPQLLTNSFAMLLLLMFVGLTSAIVLFELPSLPTLVIFFYYTIFTILFILMKGFTQNVSYVGHLGGLLGGVLSFFLFCRKSEKEK